MQLSNIGEISPPGGAYVSETSFLSTRSLSKNEIAYQKFERNLQRHYTQQICSKDILLSLFKALSDIDLSSFKTQISALHLRPELLKIITTELNVFINSSTVRFYYSDSKDLSDHGLHFGHIILHCKGIDYYLDVPSFKNEEVCVRGQAHLSLDGAVTFGTQRATGVAVAESMFNFLVHAIFSTITEF